MNVCLRYGRRSSCSIPERLARIAAALSPQKQQESSLQSPIPVVKGDLGAGCCCSCPLLLIPAPSFLLS